MSPFIILCRAYLARHMTALRPQIKQLKNSLDKFEKGNIKEAFSDLDDLIEAEEYDSNVRQIQIFLLYLLGQEDEATAILLNYFYTQPPSCLRYLEQQLIKAGDKNISQEAPYFKKILTNKLAILYCQLIAKYQIRLNVAAEMSLALGDPFSIELAMISHIAELKVTAQAEDADTEQHQEQARAYSFLLNDKMSEWGPVGFVIGAVYAFRLAKFLQEQYVIRKANAKAKKVDLTQLNHDCYLWLHASLFSILTARKLFDSQRQYDGTIFNAYQNRNAKRQTPPSTEQQLFATACNYTNTHSFDSFLALVTSTELLTPAEIELAMTQTTQQTETMLSRLGLG